MSDSDSLFSRDTFYLQFSDFYKEWTKQLTERCLPLLRESLSTADSKLSATNNGIVLEILKWYYKQLNLYAKTECTTVHNLLFPSWPDSLELPTLFLGDIHPYLVTSIMRSLIKQGACQDSGEEGSLQSAALRIVIDAMETEIGLEIPRLLEKMTNAQRLLMARFADSWVSQEGQQKKRVLETVSLVAMEDEGKKEMEELERIYVSANTLRKDVIQRIVDATADDYHLAALFLQGLCNFFDGFKDQIHGFKKSLAFKPPQLPTTTEEDKATATPYCPRQVPANDRTLWMGNIRGRMDENYILGCFEAESMSIVRVTITREKGCAFVEFDSWVAADNALKKYRSQTLPGGYGRYQLNWSTNRVLYTAYVSGLNSNVTPEKLKSIFAKHYASVEAAEIEVKDGSIKGKVIFGDVNDWSRSRNEMDGVPLEGVPMVMEGASR